MGKSMRVAYGEALKELGTYNENIVVMDADIAHSAMTSFFAVAYPERFYNFGIAEANLFCAAAGISHSGFIPFVSTVSLFGTGSAYEQIRNSISYVNANVKFGVSHSGLTLEEDGGSHQLIEDLALMRVLPGMTVFVPCDPIEMKKAVFAAVDISGPVYIRVAGPVVENITTEDTLFIPGKANIVKDGSDICIMATGLMVSEALKAAEMLEREGIKAAVVNFHTIKPFDQDTVLQMAEKCGAVVTVEEHYVTGGLGSAVAEVLAGQSSAKLIRVGIEEEFRKSDKQADLFKENGLTAENIVDKCRSIVGVLV